MLPGVGGLVPLGGRGSTFVRDIPGPPGAPTLLLLHGWTATADLNWHATYERLSRRFRVLAMDLRGHGRSSWGDGTWRTAAPGKRSIGHWRFSMSACAQDAATLLEIKHAQPAIIVGYSMGGAVAQVMAAEQPQAVRGLVLCSTSAKFFKTALTVQATRISMLGFAAVVDLIPRSLLRTALAPVVRKRSAFVGQWAADELIPASPPALIQAAAALRSFDSRKWVSKLACPTAVVVTENDRSVSTESQRSLADSIPQACALNIAGGHDVWLSQPDLFATTVERACEAVVEPIGHYRT